MRKQIIYFGGLILVSISLIYSCSKNENQNISKTKPNVEKLATVNFNEVAINSGLPEFPDNAQSRALSDRISKDPDWKGFQSNSNLLLAILIRKKVDLSDVKNFNKQEFYKLLGSDSVVYKAKVVKVQDYAGKIIAKYFPTVKACKTCGSLTQERMNAYAEKLTQLSRSSMQAKQMDASSTVAPVSDSATPSCWNPQFFACGALCGLTIEAPPAFALCMYLCYDSYCK